MERIYARDTEVYHPTAQEAKAFLKQYHFMGPGNWAKNGIYALRKKTAFGVPEMLACITVRRYRGMKFNWDIGRLVFKKNTYVLGGVTKLMSALTKDFGGEIGFAIFADRFNANSMLPDFWEFVSHGSSQNFYIINGKQYNSANLSKMGIKADDPSIEEVKNFGALDYYRWKKPNYELSIGYVYRNTYQSGKTYIGQHLYNGSKLDPDYHGSPTCEITEPLIKEEILDYAYDREALNYREASAIKAELKKGNCYNKPMSVLFLKQKISELPPEAQEEVFQIRSSSISKAMENPEYREWRSEQTKKQWADPEFRKKTCAVLKKTLNSNESRSIRSEISKRNWADPEFNESTRKKISDGLHSDNAHQKLSEAALRNWADPEYRKRISDAQKEIRNDPEVKKRISENTKRLWQDPEYREKVQKGFQSILEDPEALKRRNEAISKAKAKNRKPKPPKLTHEQLSANRKAKAADPEWRKRVSEATKKGKEKMDKAAWTEKMKGRKFWTDGVNNKMSFECPGEGWRLGCTEKKRKQKNL